MGFYVKLKHYKHFSDGHASITTFWWGGGGVGVIVNAGMRGVETCQIFDRSTEDSVLIENISNIISISLKDMQAPYLCCAWGGWGGGGGGVIVNAGRRMRGTETNQQPIT